MPHTVHLRAVIDDDLPIFYEQQLDPEANHMAAFTTADPHDRAAFAAHWAKIRDNPEITNRTILWQEQVAGHIASFMRDGDLEVTYWLGRPYWGKGIATAALRQFLDEVTARPIHGRAAADNVASRRVLEKCGFVVTGHDRGFAESRKAEIDEVVLRLDE
jgi:RimJ/RimL family protein N-acetyltransferase